MRVNAEAVIASLSSTNLPSGPTPMATPPATTMATVALVKKDANPFTTWGHFAPLIKKDASTFTTWGHF